MSIQPRGNVIRSSTLKAGYAKMFQPQIEILAWCPDEKAELPPEEVHFCIHFPAEYDAPPMIMRFKSPDTLGFFIEEITKYRRAVWPNSQKIEGES